MNGLELNTSSMSYKNHIKYKPWTTDQILIAFVTLWTVKCFVSLFEFILNFIWKCLCTTDPFMPSLKSKMIFSMVIIQVPIHFKLWNLLDTFFSRSAVPNHLKLFLNDATFSALNGFCFFFHSFLISKEIKRTKK